jgi:hypothetical protein
MAGLGFLAACACVTKNFAGFALATRFGAEISITINYRRFVPLAAPRRDNVTPHDH